MKSISFISILLTALFLLIVGGSAYADDIDVLVERIKACQDDACKKELQKEADVIFQAAGQRFNQDYAMLNEEIVVGYANSLARQIFYNLESIAHYHNFKAVFRLEKLKKLKENRDLLDREKISKESFEQMNRKIDADFIHEISRAQTFVDGKTQRIHELCLNFKDNLKGCAHLSENARKQIDSLRRRKVWKDYETTREGEKMRKTLSLASDGAGEVVINELNTLFHGVGEAKKGDEKIFSDKLINNLRRDG